MKLNQKIPDGWGHTMSGLLFFCIIFWVSMSSWPELQTDVRLTGLIGFGLLIIICTVTLFEMEDR